MKKKILLWLLATIGCIAFIGCADRGQSIHGKNSLTNTLVCQDSIQREFCKFINNIIKTAKQKEKTSAYSEKEYTDDLNLIKKWQANSHFYFGQEEKSAVSVLHIIAGVGTPKFDANKFAKADNRHAKEKKQCLKIREYDYPYEYMIYIFILILALLGFCAGIWSVFRYDAQSLLQRIGSLKFSIVLPYGLHHFHVYYKKCMYRSVTYWLSDGCHDPPEKVPLVG